MGCCQSAGIRRREVTAQGGKIVVEEHEATNIETSKGSKTLTRVNQYKLETELGKGAFGAVYKAADQTGAYVAIKLMEKGELRKKSKGLGGRPKGPSMSPKKPGSGTIVSMSILKEIAVMKARNAKLKERLKKQLATQLNMQPAVINEYESGKAVPNNAVIAKIEKALGCKLPRAPKK